MGSLVVHWGKGAIKLLELIGQANMQYAIFSLKIHIYVIKSLKKKTRIIHTKFRIVVAFSGGSVEIKSGNTDSFKEFSNDLVLKLYSRLMGDFY